MTNEPSHHAELANDYADYSLPQLQTEIEMAQARIAGLNKDLGRISAEVDRRFAGTVQTLMTAKKARSMTIEAPDGFKLKGSISQSVTWDSAMLQAIAGAMDWERARHYFKIAFTVSEATFKGLEPGTLKDQLTEARTTKLGNLKVALIAPKSDD